MLRQNFVSKLCKGLGILAFGICISILTGCGEDKPLRDGDWQGIGEGKNGPVTISLTVKEGKVTGGKVVSEAETDFAKPAIAEIIEKYTQTQTLDGIDAVSGASFTSDATFDAIENAVKASKGIPVDRITYKNGSTDIVVIGAGGAGLSAATQAASSGLEVIVLEKMGIAGGNSNFSTGGLNASETRIQRQLGIEDSNEQYFEDTMKGGHNLNDEALVRNMVEKSSDTVEWLISLGADLTDVGKMAGSTNQRTHRPQGGAAIGAHLVPILNRAASEAGAEIRLNNRVVEILEEDGKPAGVRVEAKKGDEVYEYTLKAKAIIVATGGFGANPDMLAKYRPELKNFGTTNHKGATGDAFGLVEKFNVDLVQMEQIQTHPTVVPGTGIMITEAVRGNGAIMVNREGYRFNNEMATRDVMSEAILNQSGKTAFLLFNQSVRDSLKAIENYAKQGLLTEGKDLAELASKLGMDSATLENTVAKYNEYQASGVDSDFGRPAGDMPRNLSTGPYYAIEVEPAVHHTMGGIKINTGAQVLDKNGNIVPGLFAAGEVTGGVHGANRLGGNAVCDITTYGRIAGQSAVDYVNN